MTFLRRLFRRPDPAPQEVEIQVEALREAMLLYARCGGAPTLAEWAALAPEARAALAEGYRNVRAETVLALARALQGPDGIVDVMRNLPRAAAEEGISAARSAARVLGHFPGMRGRA